jgi:hypothetical protein
MHAMLPVVHLPGISSLPISYSTTQISQESQKFPQNFIRILHKKFLSIGLIAQVTLHQSRYRLWVTDCKSKLLTVQRRHQLSGNGEGSRRRDIDSENGSTNGNGDNIDEGDNLEYMPDNRAAFLQTERSTILYQWEMFDKYCIARSFTYISRRRTGLQPVRPFNHYDTRNDYDV